MVVNVVEKGEVADDLAGAVDGGPEARFGGGGGAEEEVGGVSGARGADGKCLGGIRAILKGRC